MAKNRMHGPKLWLPQARTLTLPILLPESKSVIERLHDLARVNVAIELPAKTLGCTAFGGGSACRSQHRAWHVTALVF